MDNTTQAPVIPAGTTANGGAAYDPLQAARQQNNGQAQQPVPTANQVAGENQQINAQQPQDGQAVAELMAKKGFKSPDDIAKAYMELESQNKRVEMSLAELAKLREQDNTTQSVAPKVETQEDAIKVVETIVKKNLRPLQEQFELQTVASKYTDFNQYAEKIGRIIKENPGIGWETAYKAAKFDTLQGSQNQLREEGKQEAYQNIAQKQTATAGVARPQVQNTRPLDELIHDRTIPFAELQKIMRERFSQ